MPRVGFEVTYVRSNLAAGVQKADWTNDLSSKTSHSRRRHNEPIRTADALRVSKGVKYLGVFIPSVKYRINITKDEDGAYVATAPALPGCISEGKTRREALVNIQDAIVGYLASLKKHDEPVPPSIEEELVEVSA